MTASPPLSELFHRSPNYCRTGTTISLSLSLCVSLSSSLQGRTNIVSGRPPPPLDSSKNPSRNTNFFFPSEFLRLIEFRNWNWRIFFFSSYFFSFCEISFVSKIYLMFSENSLEKSIIISGDYFYSSPRLSSLHFSLSNRREKEEEEERGGAGPMFKT